MTVTINGTNGVTTPEVVLDNSAADGAQVVLKSSGYSDWNLDNYSGRLRAYYGATEYLTVNTSGNVGIGTSSPSYKLQVAGRVSYSGAIGEGADTTLSSFGTSIRLAESATWTTLAMYTGGSERARIDSSGNLLVGYSSRFNAEKLGVQFDGNTHVGLGISDIQASGDFARFFRSSSTQVGSISHNSTSTSYNTSSDYRLKENIQPLQNALGVVAQLNPVTYTWKEDGSDGQGFIAHELQAVVPDCVTGEKDAVDAEGNPQYQGIDTSFLVATLTAAIQELKAIVDAQGAEIAALKGTA